jgi:hypothetical protein
MLPLPARRIAARLLAPLLARLDATRDAVELNRLLIARPLLREIRALPPHTPLAHTELRVFSQWGEDGIIQYLLAQTGEAVRTFVEFGVGDYREANTRLLLMQGDWRGLVIEGDGASVARIQASELAWRYELQIRHAFLNRENVNQIIAASGLQGELGLLSVDIDGMDYWLWEAIDCVQPRIVVAEYNSLFGPQLPVSVPYDPAFTRAKAHPSHLYYGASLQALCGLAERKGMQFVGANSSGTNAFFVRRDLIAHLQPSSCAQGFVASRVRESRDRTGRLSFASGHARRALIAAMPLVDVERGTRLRVEELP